ncbi:MAG TPA: methyltransferase domain-containing protein [Ktedonobacterales bacterium]|jgi:demethylmenaquinone methyltransferase/2-methoxy-6-polyprenyl-1,4-benzoquinol methylase|nr:methyltransferase domain-containing protein [Ktedonobacterales bacterium]
MDERTKDERVLQEQMRYYQGRAAEYDATVLSEDDDDAAWYPLAQELRAWPPHIMGRLAPCEQALELACGTGIWTRCILQVAQRILAVDASPEMLALNRAKVADARVRYQLADLFTWEAEAPVDLAFAALWFSHVPSERLPPMLSMLRRAVRPGGQLCIIDEPDTSPVRPRAAEDPDLELRELRDGRQFQIVKIYRSPQRLAALCSDAGFTQVTAIPGTYFFGLIAQ